MKIARTVSSLPFVVCCIILITGYCPSITRADQSWRHVQSLTLPADNPGVGMPVAVYGDLRAQKLYVVDSAGNRLLSYAKDGSLIHSFTAENGLAGPMDMVKKDTNTIYLLQQSDPQMTIIHLRQKRLEKVDLGADEGLLPRKIELFDDRLYAMDAKTGGVYLLSDSFHVEKRYACSDCSLGFIDFQVSGDVLYALQKGAPKIDRFDLRSDQHTTIGLQSRLFPVSLAVAKDGTFFVVDRKRAAVQVFDPQGRFRYRLFEKGSAPGQLSYPLEIRFDPWGRLCVVNEGNGSVEVYTK